jgi:very-short-patch-repair endonuclease
MPRSPIPAHLRGTALRTSTGFTEGLSRKRLRADDVQHPFHGVSSFACDLDLVRDRCRALVPVMEPGQTFSHTTALALHGAPLPVPETVVHVSVKFPRTPPRRPGVRGHALVSNPGVRVDGLPVAPSVAAWGQSAAVLPREELVAVGDDLVARGRATTAELARTAAAWERRPGSARLQWAAARVRSGVRSRPESLLRLLLVRARLPEPEVAYPVVVAGGVVLHPDLAYPAQRLALEYEGDIHRSRSEWERDIERREWMAEAGWRTVRVTRAHLFHRPDELISRVRRHLRG